MAHVYIGIGTNVGSRMENLISAKSRLFSSNHIECLKESTVIETKPVDYLKQPDFLNQIVLIETNIRPQALLTLLKKIESDMGRKKTISKGPRIIDLDILLYDDQIIKTKELVIPHPRIMMREFILKHLVEIEPGLTDPVDNRRYLDIYKEFQ